MTSKLELQKQIHYLLDSLRRISTGSHIQTVERNAAEEPSRNPDYPLEANLVAGGMCIGIYVRLRRHNKIDIFEEVAVYAKRCTTFSGRKIDAAQVKSGVDDIMRIFDPNPRYSIFFLQPPSIEKRRSTEELTPDQSKQTKLARKHWGSRIEMRYKEFWS